jgi:tetratricopeptide (TPR) repeat protein
MVLAPERSGLEFMLAHWSIAYGRFEEAAQWLVKGLKREPESAHAPILMVRLFGSLGMWEQAWASIALGRENSPGNVEYIDQVASFYFRSGDYNEFSKFVASEYAKVDQAATSKFLPTSKKRYFWHGFAAINAGNYVQAIEDLTNAAGGPTGIENLVYDQIGPVKYMAYALQQQGLGNEADELLDKCLSLATGAMDQGWATPMILYRTAQVYALLGQSDDAIEHLRQAVDKGWPAPIGDLETDPLWSNVRHDSRFQVIVAETNHYLETQRDRVSSILGDIPVEL